MDFEHLYARTILRGTPLGDLFVGPLETAGRGFAVLTAACPMSLETLDASEEARRMAALADHLRSAGFDPLPCTGESPEGDHAEQSWWAWDLPLATALELGEAYEQRAVFFCDGRTLRVVFTPLHKHGA